VVDGEFVFRPDRHDAAKKTVLGVTLPKGRGIEDGEEVLRMVASHPATARHLARKLAVRFVADEPPAALVDRLAARYLATGGDVAMVLRELLRSPEFWDPNTRGAKIKTPFELVTSSLRAVDAEVGASVDLLHWIAQMGEPIGLYEAPTGYPDRAEQWVGAGALLTRMSYALQLSAGRIPGVTVDLDATLGGQEPESTQVALEAFWPRLLPTRPPGDAITTLAALAADPELTAKVDAGVPEPVGDPLAGFDVAMPGPPGARFGAQRRITISNEPPTAMQLALGVLIGSPEFQRR
jgi:hypothetical protein